MRQLQEIPLLELENELPQCHGESERATVDGFKMHDSAKNMKLGNNRVAGSETAGDFMNPMVSKAEVRAQFRSGLQCAGLNLTNDDNRFNFSELTVKVKKNKGNTQVFTIVCLECGISGEENRVNSLQHVFRQVRFQWETFEQ